ELGMTMSGAYSGLDAHYADFVLCSVSAELRLGKPDAPAWQHLSADCLRSELDAETTDDLAMHPITHGRRDRRREVRSPLLRVRAGHAGSAWLWPAAAACDSADECAGDSDARISTRADRRPVRVDTGATVEDVRPLERLRSA